MNVVIAVLLLAASLWLIWAVFKRLKSTRANALWWVATLTALTAGLVFGWHVANSFEYQVSQRFRFASAPLPIVIFVWEEDHWTDFVTPLYYAYPAMAANTLSISAILISPLLLIRKKRLTDA